MSAHATALIADDEPLLREALRRQLAIVWPELEIVAEARNGREAVRLFDERHPDICFLDVHMPGLSGVDAANHIGRRAHLVFVTAYDHYAVQAFAQGALDYLLKPVEQARLAETVSRLRERLHLSRQISRDSQRACVHWFKPDITNQSRRALFRVLVVATVHEARRAASPWLRVEHVEQHLTRDGAECGDDVSLANLPREHLGARRCVSDGERGIADVHR
jgi:YesN/AraC family two-component response regulator